MLEAISLAYGLKTFAPYIFNCQRKVAYLQMLKHLSMQNASLLTVYFSTEQSAI
jgi:hypothetical protein